MSFQVPSDFQFAYRFSGVVHPVRGRVELFDIGLARVQVVFATSSFPAYVHIVGEQSNFRVAVYTSETVADVLSLKNCIKGLVESRVDIICFYQGCYYEPEIVSCCLPDGAEVTFGVELRAIRELADVDLRRVSVATLMTHRCAHFFLSALKDYKRAMQDPLETYFYVYRAIESIRGYFADIHGLDPDAQRSKTWEILRSELGYAKESFELLTARATARRHGQMQFHSEAELVECLRFGWNLLTKFVEITFKSDFRIQPDQPPPSSSISNIFT